MNIDPILAEEDQCERLRRQYKAALLEERRKWRFKQNIAAAMGEHVQAGNIVGSDFVPYGERVPKLYGGGRYLTREAWLDSDRYTREMLARSSAVLSSGDIPDELVKLKKLQLQIKRHAQEKES